MIADPPRALNAKRRRWQFNLRTFLLSNFYLQFDARNVNKTAATDFAILLADGKTSIAIAMFLRNYKKCK
jgi:hypothetical protein